MKYIVWLTFLTACGPTFNYAGPAPPGALNCALEHGRAAGYELIEGAVDADFIRLVQPIPPPPAEGLRPDDPVPRAVDLDRPVENQMLIAIEDDRLTLTVLGVTDAGVRVGPGSNAEDQARTILALCTSSPPVFPSPDASRTLPR